MKSLFNLLLFIISFQFIQPVWAQTEITPLQFELLNHVCPEMTIIDEDFQLTEEEKQLQNFEPVHKLYLRAYTKKCYYELNNALRNQTKNPEILTFSAKLTEGIRKFPRVKRMVYRGVFYDENVLAQYRFKSKVRFLGYTSTSTSQITASQFATNVLLRIYTQTGRDIDLSSYMKGEKEIVILPKTQFQVIGRKKNVKTGVIEITLKEILPLKKSKYSKTQKH